MASFKNTEREKRIIVHSFSYTKSKRCLSDLYRYIISWADVHLNVQEKNKRVLDIYDCDKYLGQIVDYGNRFECSQELLNNKTFKERITCI